MTNSFDTIVIGLGGMGSAAAYHLAQRGQRVLGLERFTPAHNRGSSHGSSRIIRQAYFEDPAYVPLLQRAYELWEALEQDAGAQLLRITGGLMMGKPEYQTFSGSVRSAREWNLPHEILDANDIRKRFSPLNPAPDDVGLYEARAGYLHPEECVRAHLRLAEAHGAALHFEEPALSWQDNGNGVQVATGRATYHASKLVIAPGAWAPELMATLELPFKVTRQTLYWFDPISGAQAFEPEVFPIFIWEQEHGDMLYGFPKQAGVPGVKTSFFYRGVFVDPNNVDRAVSDEAIQEMRVALAQSIPSLNGPLLDTVTCLYTEVPDHHFVVAPHPHYENVVIASPCSGHGFKFCSVMGEVLAGLVVDGRTPHPIELFDPARFAATA